MSLRCDGKMLVSGLLLVSCLWVRSSFVEFRHSSMSGPRRTRLSASQGPVLRSLLMDPELSSKPKTTNSVLEKVGDSFRFRGDPSALEQSSSVVENVGDGFRFKVDPVATEQSVSVLENIGTGFRFKVDKSIPETSSTVLGRVGSGFRFKVDPRTPTTSIDYQKDLKTNPGLPSTHQDATAEASSRGQVLRNAVLVAGGIALGLQFANSAKEEERKKREEEERNKPYEAVLSFVAAGSALLVGLQTAKAAKARADKKKMDDETEKQFGFMWSPRFLEGRREPFVGPFP